MAGGERRIWHASISHSAFALIQARIHCCRRIMKEVKEPGEMLKSMKFFGEGVVEHFGGVQRGTPSLPYCFLFCLPFWGVQRSCKAKVARATVRTVVRTVVWPLDFSTSRDLFLHVHTSTATSRGMFILRKRNHAQTTWKLRCGARRNTITCVNPRPTHI